jgi:hypothetical protein
VGPQSFPLLLNVLEPVEPKSSEFLSRTMETRTWKSTLALLNSATKEIKNQESILNFHSSWNSSVCQVH